MDSRDRHILECAVHAIAEQAAKTNDLIDEAMEAGLAKITPSPSQPRCYDSNS